MILLVPAPAVITPLVIVQTYPVPVPQLRTDAVLPVDDLQTAAEAIIAAFGKALTNTL